MPQYFTCSCCFIKKRRGEIRNETIYFECNINLKSNENTDRSDVKNKHENLNSEKYGHIFFLLHVNIVTLFFHDLILLSGCKSNGKHLNSPLVCAQMDKMKWYLV